MVFSQIYLAEYLALSKYSVNNCRLTDQTDNYNFASPYWKWSCMPPWITTILD